MFGKYSREGRWIWIITIVPWSTVVIDVLSRRWRRRIGWVAPIKFLLAIKLQY